MKLEKKPLKGNYHFGTRPPQLIEYLALEYHITFKQGKYFKQNYKNKRKIICLLKNFP